MGCAASTPVAAPVSSAQRVPPSADKPNETATPVAPLASVNEVVASKVFVNPPAVEPAITADITPKVDAENTLIPPPTKGADIGDIAEKFVESKPDEAVTRKTENPVSIPKQDKLVAKVGNTTPPESPSALSGKDKLSLSASSAEVSIRQTSNSISFELPLNTPSLSGSSSASSSRRPILAARQAPTPGVASLPPGPPPRLLERLDRIEPLTAEALMAKQEAAERRRLEMEKEQQERIRKRRERTLAVRMLAELRSKDPTMMEGIEKYEPTLKELMSF